MAKVLIGKWGKSLGVRFPTEIAKAMDLKSGEEVEVKIQDRKIVVARPDEAARARADAAAKRIVARSRGHSLGGLSIRELIDEGRKY